MRKVEYDGLATAVKSGAAELKAVLAQGETNDSIQNKLNALKIEVAGLETKLKPFVSSGAKLVTEAEL